MRYRRAYISGGTFFFTLVTYKRQRIFSSPDSVRAFMEGFQKIQISHPFINVAIVILPDHLHAIWTLPETDSNYSARWRLIKGIFTRMIRAQIMQAHPVWQNRFWEHLIRDEHDLQKHVDYIHFNPVKHGLVHEPEKWPFSSIHRYIREGYLPAGWGGSILPDFGKDIGGE